MRSFSTPAVLATNAAKLGLRKYTLSWGYSSRSRTYASWENMDHSSRVASWLHQSVSSSACSSPWLTSRSSAVASSVMYVVLDPTSAWYSIVLALWNRKTASCSSIAAPNPESSRFPELPTSAHVSWRNSTLRLGRACRSSGVIA